MQLAVEGPSGPDVREAKEEELAVFNEFLEKAYRMWLTNSTSGIAVTLWCDLWTILYFLFFHL